jgi:hypothetical protein
MGTTCSREFQLAGWISDDIMLVDKDGLYFLIEKKLLNEGLENQLVILSKRMKRGFYDTDRKTSFFDKISHKRK